MRSHSFFGGLFLTLFTFFLISKGLHSEIMYRCSCYKPVSSYSYKIEPYSIEDWPANMIAKEWKKIDLWRYATGPSPIRNENYLGRDYNEYHALLGRDMGKRRLLGKKFFEFYGPGNITGSTYCKLSGPETGQYPSDFSYMFELSRELVEVGYRVSILEREFLQKIRLSYHILYGGVFLKIMIRTWTSSNKNSFVIYKR